MEPKAKPRPFRKPADSSVFEQTAAPAGLEILI